MPKAALVKRGEKYLPGVPPAKLEAMYRRERPGKSRKRLQAAVLRKQDELLEKIAGMMGRGVGTIYRWLFRMEREGPEGRHDNKSPGRPRLLNPEQEKAIKEDLDGTPRECGFGHDSWNARMLTRRMLEWFGVPCNRSASRRAHQLGFSVRKSPIRPIQQRHARGAEGVRQEEKGDRRKMGAGTRHGNRLDIQFVM